MKIKGKIGVADEDGDYVFTKIVSAEDLFCIAASVVERHLRRGDFLSKPSDSKRYLALQIGMLEHEAFCCVFLDTRHRLIVFEQMFRGTVDGASVYPREVVKRALYHNAAAVVLAHNHPSGVAEPSQADRAITRRITEALSLVDIRVLDHIVVAGTETVSFAERGLL